MVYDPNYQDNFYDVSLSYKIYEKRPQGLYEINRFARKHDAENFIKENQKYYSNPIFWYFEDSEDYD